MTVLNDINIVELVAHTKLGVAVLAVRNCYDSLKNSDTLKNSDEWSKENLTRNAIVGDTDRLGKADKDLLLHILNNKHTSTLEHIVYTFVLSRVPRSVLQELVRHRIASYSIKSSRYTLCKELRNEEPFISNSYGELISQEVFDRASRYIAIYKESMREQIFSLEILRDYIVRNDIRKSDEAKHLLPEAWLTNIIMTINLRSLRNLLQLRTSDSAYSEIKDLALNMHYMLPNEHKFLYDDIVEDMTEY